MRKIPGGCWRFLGGRTAIEGHCRIRVTPETLVHAYVGTHRVSYIYHHGPIPVGFCVLHHCDIPRCIHPEHIFAGDHSDNMLDMVSKGRRGPPLPGSMLKGEDSAASKLTESEVLEIRYLYEEGKHSYASLGGMFGVTDVNIWNICKRRTWKHI